MPGLGGLVDLFMGKKAIEGFFKKYFQLLVLLKNYDGQNK